MVPVIRKSGEPAVMPSNDTVIDGSYPIARPLFMYTNGEPTGATKTYLDWILSDAGQRVLQDHGYPPLRKL
jgi:phosphate transport system substrate-binding protein